MPRSTIANRVGRIYDSLLSLYAATLPAISATTQAVGLPFPATKSIEYECVINPLAYTGFVTGVTSWSIAIQAATSLGGTYTTVASIELNGTAAQRIISLAGIMIQSIVPEATHLRVVATKLGSPGNLQFGAFLTDID